MSVWSRTSMTTGSHAFFSVAAPRSTRASCSGVKPFSFLPGNLSIIPIELVFCDVTLHGRGQLAGDRSAGCDIAPQPAGRHVWGRNVAQDDARRVEPEAGELGWLGRREVPPGC